MVQQLLEYVIASLVDVPEEVDIRRLESERAITWEIRVAQGDMGKVIGRNGRVASAIRTVARAAAGHDGARIFVEFQD